ncbi:MAG: hypothetical protein ABSG25_11685 [Bryobacteraceae bacterium]
MKALKWHETKDDDMFCKYRPTEKVQKGSNWCINTCEFHVKTDDKNKITYCNGARDIKLRILNDQNYRR